MKNSKTLAVLFLLAVLLGAGCGTKEAAPEPVKQVADAADMAEITEVTEPWMVPLGPDCLMPGSYPVTVDSSSSMFRITACTLTVEEGRMTAEMTMGGTGYRCVFPGTGEEAARAGEADVIPYTEGAAGENIFTVPVPALDEGVPLAAISKKKELWYDRTLCFRSDSLPLDAFRPNVLKTPANLGLKDGRYLAEVRLAGGSGRGSVTSPAELTVEAGQCTALIQWSSPNYDYMKVGDAMFYPVNEGGNSAFVIPVSCFDRGLSVLADTTAMSQPHEIAYTLVFDASTIEERP